MSVFSLRKIQLFVLFCFPSSFLQVGQLLSTVPCLLMKEKHGSVGILWANEANVLESGLTPKDGTVKSGPHIFRLPTLCFWR